MDDGSQEKIVPERAERRLVIGIDYGTTFTGLAYATPYGRTCALHEIDVVQNWGPQMGNHDKVASRIAYTTGPSGEGQQWGAAIDASAVTMVHTKLELDPTSISDELDSILHSLQGMKNLHFEYIKDSTTHSVPAYTHKTSEEIVTDYLTNLFRCAEQVVEALSADLGTRSLLSTDIVITIPTEWSYKAMNSTFRAISAAGLNQQSFPMLKEVIFVSESEAAAVYTARYLRDTFGQDFLQLNESFVLCDAGGGTVDVVSYTVRQLHPSLQLELVSKPTGAKCGSIFINMAFKNWLRLLIGEENYRQLDPYMETNKISSHSTEGRAMRELMKDFDARKHLFHANYTKDINIDLPAPLNNLNIPGRVDRGEITIPSDRMESFFDQSVEPIVTLINDHLKEIRKKGTGIRTKNVFLVGGFGRSEYLRDQVKNHLSLEKLKLRMPDDKSWTAVVQGAVICGIEKSSSQKLVRAGACRHHYGIAPNQIFSDAHHSLEDRVEDPKTGLVFARGQMNWLLNKGDLVRSSAPLIVEKEITLTFLKSEEKKKIIPIYRYSRDDDRPERYHEARNEVLEVCRLDINLTAVPKGDWEYVRSRNASKLKVLFKMVLTGDKLTASVWRGARN
ncbi:hypothetical protein B0J11DRAFT_471111 [Dendryphion nanum]|uniref:Actin-like ATPase domain-containing protein n=1 Tax=Dendryphion nanum TaxID=256645 RepID=A0A9P9D9W8_9PLEO|nr:hypothetical protein B0J11DRAFT_471111 [Dendryphion nanum]